MKYARFAGLAALLVPALLAAQQPANPTSDAGRQVSSRFARLLTQAAEDVPADKLSYAPTPPQLTFGKIWAHLTEGNYTFCGAIGGMKAPEMAELKGTESKDVLVAALKKSFAFCDSAYAKTDDSNLGETVDLGFMKGTRALAMFIYVDDLADHYSQVANYMRLNDMLPPSARPRKQ